MNTFYKHFIALIGIAACFLLPQQLHGQADRTNIDSIKATVQSLSSDTDRVSTLLDRVGGFDCDDSAKKLLLANEAKRLAESIKWRPGIITANRILGQVYLQCQKNRAKGLEYLQLNVEFSHRNKDTANEAVALETIARTYADMNEHQKSIEYYTKVLELHPGLDEEAMVLGNIGVIFTRIGDYNPALLYFDSSLNLIRSKKIMTRQDSSEVAAVYLNMADLSLVNLHPDEAFKKYEQVLHIGVNLGKNLEIWGLSGMGRSFRMKKQYQNAIDKYQQALKVCQEKNIFEEEVKIKDELASTYLETWELPMAQAYADSALGLAENQHYIGLLSKANAVMGNVYLKQNKFDLAISFLQKALEIAKQTNSLEDKRDAYESLEKAFRQSGKMDLAFEALQNFYDTRDSLTNIEKLNEFTKNELRIDFTTRKKIDSVKTQADFTKKIERQRVYTYSGFIGLVLVLLLAFFMYRSYVTQKKYNELLAIEKKRHLAHIEAQSNILSDIADAQAHQIRGPISTILGLVHIFNFDDPTDPMNKQVMEWITSTTEKLDAAVKDVIIRENKLRSEHDDSDANKV